MKQLKIMDQKTILNIFNFYRDIGIDIIINQFQNGDKTKLINQIKSATEKKIDNIFIKEKKINSINELEKLFKNFEGCKLKKTATNFVKFQGNENANLLFIDGTPNTEEDQIGKSFVSAKGDLFEKMINAIDIKLDDIFIINAIPWRPPGNRYPTEEEIKICRPFIFNLINILRPKVIVCLGEVPTNQILELNQSIIKTRGKWHYFKSDLINQFDSEYKPHILPTLSISYLLNRPDMKRKAWEDMKMLRDKIREM
ncbi:uracil-DNA glycosylase [Alphaproteobacteria bacterium]|nr:uracil-DNA glycosylase [Alphaproteobacteria bacterium]